MNTVKIGQQEWATEDLKVTKFRNGEDIPLVTFNWEWKNLTTAAYCISPNGHYLYNGYAVNDPRGLAPEGFHVPTDEEWTELVDALGGEKVAGKKMKTNLPVFSSMMLCLFIFRGLSSKLMEKWNGTNSSGFFAFPGGYRSATDGLFYFVGLSINWWSSSTNFVARNAWYRWWFSSIVGTDRAWARSIYDCGFLDSSGDEVYRDTYSLRDGFSVRCLKTINTKDK